MCVYFGEAAAADNWRGTPGRWSPLNPDPLPFQPALFTLGAYCVCVWTLTAQPARDCICVWVCVCMSIFTDCPPPVIVWASECVCVCVLLSTVSDCRSSVCVKEQQVIQLCYKRFRPDWWPQPTEKALTFSKQSSLEDCVHVCVCFFVI